MKEDIRKTLAYRTLRAKARAAIVAYVDGADFGTTVLRLASIGEEMSTLLA